MDESYNEDKIQASSYFRVWMCGAFRVERRVDPSEENYQALRVNEWGGSTYPRLLLKALLCCPGRQARREALLTLLWPDVDFEQATQYLNTATTKLRSVLRPAKNQESLFISEEDSTLYRLAGQERIWVDVDEAMALLSHVERLGRTSTQALPSLERAHALLQGGFLEEESGLWISGRRATIERSRYRCRLWLAELYASHERFGQAEGILSALLEEDPFDEDVICRFMELYHQQGMVYQALRLFHQTCDMLAKEGLTPTETTKKVAAHIKSDKQHVILPLPRRHTIDWGEAPALEHFSGRFNELAVLQENLIKKHKRLLALYGMGGIGKTSLAVAFVTSVQEHFDAILWRSLHHAPSVQEVLQDCVLFFSRQQQTSIPETFEEQLVFLLRCFRERRCLLILDNCESIFQPGTVTGLYRDGYDTYGRLFQRLGEAQHHSCLLLTSREEIKEVTRLEGTHHTVHTLHLTGIGLAETKDILLKQDIVGSDDAYMKLLHLYGGNPLALKLIAEPLRTTFHANITAFLQEGYSLVSDVHDLLEQQFLRLSTHEQTLMYWLAIEREPVAIETLWEDSISFLSKKELLNALTSLRRRSLVLSSTKEEVTLHPVIMEYVTDQFVERVVSEVLEGICSLFDRHALIKAQAKEYIRETQTRLILARVGERLLMIAGRNTLEEHLQHMLTLVHQHIQSRPSYAAGNLLNLCVHLQYDLRGFDFSHLSIRQAFLQATQLTAVNFSYADLSTSVFRDSFGSIFTVAFHPSLPLLAAGTASGEVRLWNIKSGTPMHIWHGHTDWVRSLAFSPDGTLIASGSEDKTIRVWHVESKRCLNIFHGHDSRIRSLSFNSNGERIASGSEDSTIRIWSLATNTCLHVLQGHHDQVRAVVFFPHEERVASGSDDGTIRIWNSLTGRCLNTVDVQDGPVFALTCSPDGQILASAGNTGIISLWQRDTYQCLTQLRGPQSRIRSLAFFPNAPTLVSGSEDHMVRLWSVTSEQPLDIFCGHSNAVFAVACHPEGTCVASGSEDHTIRLWDMKTGHCLKTLRGYTDQIRAIAFHPDGRRIVSGHEDATLKLWNMEDGHVQRALHGHQRRVRTVAFSSDGQKVASGSEDDTVKLWDVSTGHCLNILEGHTRSVRSVTFHPHQCIIASGSEDHTVKLWDGETGLCLTTFEGHSNKVRSIAFSPDGTMLASGSEDQTIRLWDIQQRVCCQVLQDQKSWIWSLTFNSDGNIIACGYEDHMVRLWNVHTGECLGVLQGHTDRVRSLAFSPDGTILASGSEDTTIRLWELHTGTCLHVLHGHQRWVWSVAFSPDGNTIAGGSDDGTITLWHTQTGRCLSTLRNSRPYEQMNITGAKGLTQALHSMLLGLGAYEHDANSS